MSGDSRGYWGDKEHTGRLRISRGAWPAPEGAQFHEESVTQGEGGGAAVCRRGRLLWKNDLVSQAIGFYNVLLVYTAAVRTRSTAVVLVLHEESLIVRIY